MLTQRIADHIRCRYPLLDSDEYPLQFLRKMVLEGATRVALVWWDGHPWASKSARYAPYQLPSMTSTMCIFFGALHSTKQHAIDSALDSAMNAVRAGHGLSLCWSSSLYMYWALQMNALPAVQLLTLDGSASSAFVMISA